MRASHALTLLVILFAGCAAPPEDPPAAMAARAWDDAIHVSASARTPGSTGPYHVILSKEGGRLHVRPPPPLAAVLRAEWAPAHPAARTLEIRVAFEEGEHEAVSKEGASPLEIPLDPHAFAAGAQTLRVDARPPAPAGALLHQEVRLSLVLTYGEA